MTTGAATVSQNADHFAVVIGNDHYPELGDLRTAGSSASAFGAWLASAEGGGLPQGNIQLFRSSPDARADEPQKWVIERALRYMGTSSGARIGQRLYVYFAGYAFSHGTDDVGIVLADTTPQKLVTCSLASVRELLTGPGSFDELVLVCDFTTVVGVTIPPGTLSIATLRRSERPEVRQLVITGGLPAESGEVRLLTRAVLEGLSGAVAGSDRRVRSSDLARHVVSRVQELGAQIGMAVAATTRTSGPGDIVFTPLRELPRATLVVELPHKLADVQIYDPLLNPLPSVGPVTTRPGSATAPSIAVSETVLAPGVYDVRVILQGSSERKAVIVRPGRTQRIRGDSWKKLHLVASAPLKDAVPPLRSATTPWDPEVLKAHTKQAQEWSRRRTWADGPGGESAVFLFVREPDPRGSRTFAGGLTLHDAAGSVVTDLSHGIEARDEEGWLAFSANMAPGFYSLRHGRRCVGLFLARGWQTQAFLTVRDRPSFRTLTMHMAPLGPPDAGFVADDELACATEVLLAALRTKQRAWRLVNAGPMQELLRREPRNPWLSILVAHVLVAGREEGSPDAPGAMPLDPLLEFLGTAFPEHPDVRALRLRDQDGPTEPFSVPPVLRAGLERVRRQAVRHATTIALGSVSDDVFARLVTNSPWTTWRAPRSPADGSEETSPSDPTQAGSATPRRPRLFVSRFLQNLPLSAPVFRLDEPLDAIDPASATAQEARPAAPGEAPLAPGIATFRDAPLIQAAQRLLGDRVLEGVEDILSVDVVQTLTSLLGSVAPGEVSTVTGIPLARIQAGLDRLRRRCETPQSSSAQWSLSRAERAVAAYALSRGATLSSPPAPSVAAPAMSPDAQLFEPPASTIEDSVIPLQSAAERLLLTGQETDPGTAAAIATPLAKRLRRLAEHLLRSADFVVTTDAQGQLLRANGAFRMLLSGSAGALAAPTPEERRAVEQSERQAWVSALAAAPNGESRLTSPVNGSLFDEWQLRRIPVKQGQPQAPQEYLNVLHAVGPTRLGPDTLPTLERMISQISLHASLFAQGSSETRTESAGRLDAVIADAERLLGIGGAAPP